MIYRILRYVIAILVGTAAYVGMDSLAPIMDPYLVSQFESFGDMSLTIARISVLILGTLLGVIIGYLISSFILKQGLVIAKRLERILTHIPNQELIAGTIGLLFGLIIANLIGVAFNQVPIIGPYIPIILSAIFGYSGLKIRLVKALKCTITMYNNGVEKALKKQVVLKCSLLINLIKLRVHQNY